MSFMPFQETLGQCSFGDTMRERTDSAVADRGEDLNKLLEKIIEKLGSEVQWHPPDLTFYEFDFNKFPRGIKNVNLELKAK